jgi:3-oxoacyl-[acyl-carrier protein] reductase
MRLTNRTALVTGGSSGIGAAIAKRLAADGAGVALTFSRNERDAQSIVREIETKGGRAVALPLDLTQAESLSNTFDEVARQLGGVDIVVANAGNVFSKPIAEAGLAELDAAFAVNTRGALLTIAEAARRVPRGGRIIGISTVLTRQPRAGMGLYAASKAALEQFIYALAQELGAKEITANAVAPGPTDTRLVVPARREQAPKVTPLGRLATPDDIADVVAFLASDDARWISGQVIGANGGMA